MIFIALCFPDSEQRSRSRAGRWGEARAALCPLQTRPGREPWTPALPSIGAQIAWPPAHLQSWAWCLVPLVGPWPGPVHASSYAHLRPAHFSPSPGHLPLFHRCLHAAWPCPSRPSGWPPPPSPGPSPAGRAPCLQTPCSAPALDPQPRWPSRGASGPCPCSPRSWHKQPLGLEHRLPLCALFREGLCSSFVECPLIGIFFPQVQTGLCVWEEGHREQCVPWLRGTCCPRALCP